MDVSVVITTFNRGPSLRQTLLGLRRQTYRHFEVVVVHGPSTDDTEAVLAEFGGDVRVAACPEDDPAKSRNLGIALAAGAVVAFLDDDAVPQPHWLEELVAGYDTDRVAGVGGPVCDPADPAPRPNAAATACDRFGNPFENVRPPYWGYSLPRPERVLHLPGSNASFRRRCLQEIGGFDAQIEPSLDLADVCLRLVDQGYHLRLLPGAVVYRKPPPDASREPFAALKNRTYFALRARAPGVPVEAVMEDCDRFAARVVEDASTLSADERAAFAEEVDRGRWVGVALGQNGARKLATIPPARAEQFTAFPTRHAGPDALTVCFVSPGNDDEFGRIMRELARGFADRGHEIHFLTRSPDHYRVALEGGVWVHRLVPETEGPWCSPDLSPVLRKNLARAAAVHREVRRIRASSFVDLVSVSLRDSAGLYCLLDDDLTCVLALQMPLKIVKELDLSQVSEAEQCALLALEELALRAARHVHSVSMPDEAHGEPDADASVERALRAFADIIARRKAA